VALLRVRQKLAAIIKFIWRHKKYWLSAILLIVLAGLIWVLWFWQSGGLLWRGTTYSKASVLGTNVGGLDVSQLSDQLKQIKTNFESKEVTLVNGESRWAFKATDLGLAIDEQATGQAVLQLNNFSLADKYRLLMGRKSPIVKPVITLDSTKCQEALGVISIPPVTPVSATVYFEGELKLTADTPGSQFNAASSCQKLPELLAANSFTIDAFLDTTPATITKADLQAKLPQIQTIIGQPLTLTKDSYSQTLSTEQLLAMIEITKNDADVQIGWPVTKVDELVNAIAAQVDTYNASPALGNCQYLASSGGNWLDKAATKQIFDGLATNSSRSYALPIVYHEPVVGTRTPVAAGNNGTVYLTFDDGLTFGNQIMDYAACYGVKVTFFELGPRVGTDAAALRRAIAEGHAVQAHGYEHAVYDYGQHSYDWQYNDIKQSIDAITSVTGVRPTYFRPPGGNKSSDTYAAAAANGVSVILWGVSSIDTSWFGSDGICSNVLNGAYAGASVLMHSTKQKTADAVPCIIEGLAAKGFNMQALR
jgi:peptidoglycan/xylan/chitin deacetylase (PgdA/CDA1 family)